jgi:hypothetical protein
VFFENAINKKMGKIRYFPHDVDARNDPKLVLLRHKLGWSSVAIYWSLVEMLYENSENKLETDYKLLSKILQYNVKKIQEIVEKFELFLLSADKKYFYSARIKDTINEMEIARQKRSNAGRLGGLASRKNKKENENSEAMLKQCLSNAEAFKKSVTQSNTVKFKHSTSNVECSGHARDFLELFDKNSPSSYPQEFCVWYSKYGHSPYPDSLENSFEEWKKLTADEQKLCLSVVDIYVSLRNNPHQRHNPWRYLQNKIFLISSLHTLANTGDSAVFQTTQNQQESRAAKRIKSVYGNEIEQNQFRNKVEKWEN